MLRSDGASRAAIHQPLPHAQRSCGRARLCCRACPSQAGYAHQMWCACGAFHARCREALTPGAPAARPGLWCGSSPLLNLRQTWQNPALAPAMPEKAIASGIIAKATTRPERMSRWGLPHHALRTTVTTFRCSGMSGASTAREGAPQRLRGTDRHRANLSGSAIVQQQSSAAALRAESLYA